MHKWAKEILECVKKNAEVAGYDKFSGQTLDDLKDWTEIVKNIACFDKDYRIIEAMEKAEDSGKIMDMLEMYEDYPDRRYYDHYRYSNGRFAPKGSGTYRRGYEEPPYYHVMPREYHDYSDMENMRDMDRNRGRMYYADQHSESRYDRAKRMYTESKELHKGNTPADKDQKMKDLEGYFKEISDDITGMIVDASPEEKAMLRTKLTTLAGKV
nr:MAG TPA: hypothetical protein [Caudoviricetes sp.]